jgi:hypothetical protein
MSLNLSGEITAIATAVLAVFAIVTAIYAIRAFRKAPPPNTARPFSTA